MFFLLAFLGFRVRPKLATIQWSMLTAKEFEDKFHSFQLQPRDWMPRNGVYYLAEHEDNPVAFVTSNCLSSSGRPIASFCGMNRELLEENDVLHCLWSDFEIRFEMLPVFSNNTVFLCGDSL